MRILVTGNMGYVGPVLLQHLRASYPDAMLIGFDTGYFADCLTTSRIFPECRADIQYFGDVRRVSPDIFVGVDAVVHLAAISNDPMGAKFEDVTLAINHGASIRVAQLAKQAGVKRFVFASSCSVYGLAAGCTRTERDAVNPLTAYAKSKVLSEEALSVLADDGFTVTCLRFATACGMSERLRLDLVLNDFVASALTSRRITILSDGTPWRPLIHVKDMARAIEWGIQRQVSQGGMYLALNAGSDKWNYQVKELAAAVAQAIPKTSVVINAHAQPDKRSYRVSFGQFQKLAPGYLPQISLSEAIEDLSTGMRMIDFDDHEFRTSHLIRLNRLHDLRDTGYLTDQLEWVHPFRPPQHETVSSARRLPGVRVS